MQQLRHLSLTLITTILDGVLRLFSKDESPEVRPEPIEASPYDTRPVVSDTPIFVFKSAKNLVIGFWGNPQLEQALSVLEAKHEKSTNTWRLSASDEELLQSAVEATTQEPDVIVRGSSESSITELRRRVNQLRGYYAARTFSELGIPYTEAPRNTFTVTTRDGRSVMYHSKTGKWRWCDAADRTYQEGYSPSELIAELF